jgi:hypothetical protein
MRGMSDPDWERLDRAMRLGPMARFRLRAECLLGYADRGEIPLTDDEREEVERITVAPKPEDGDFLGSFDVYFEKMQDEEDEKNERDG